VFSRDPEATRGLMLNQTMGSYGTSRTYARLETGDLGGGNRLARAAPARKGLGFCRVQGGWQANAKFTHEDSAGKLTAYFAFGQDRAERGCHHPLCDPHHGGAGLSALYPPLHLPQLG
jgi:hypothetical protein